VPKSKDDQSYRTEHLRLLLEAAGAATWEMDLATGEVRVSDEQLGLYGLLPGSPLGFAEWIKLVHPDDQARVAAKIQAGFAGEPYAEIYRILRADTGEMRWIQSLGRRTQNSSTQTPIFVGVNLDITETRQAELILRDQSARLRAIYNGAPIGLCSVDREMRYLEINARLAEMNGAPAEAHIGQTIRDMVPAVADQVEPIYRRVLEAGEPVANTICRGTTAAHPHQMHEWLVSYHPIRHDGAEVSAVSVAIADVTELRHAVEAARTAEQATARFLAAMNHEFRTPVGLVIGFADLLYEAAERRGFPKDVVGHLTDIRAAAQHLLGLVEDATQYCRLTEAGLGLAYRAVRVRTVIDDAVRAVGSELATLNLTLPPVSDEGPEVFVHSPTLREGFAGLFREIARRAPHGAVVEISWCTHAKGIAVVQVCCAELALPQAVEERPTAPISTAVPLGRDLVHGRGLMGAGLGVAIAERSARANGGQLTIESAPDRGTCFSFALSTT
jgi:PAS domain S-box-containing protein